MKTLTSLEVNARRVRRQLPRSWFTKKGPGVESRAKLAFQLLTPFDRAIAIKKGWFPPAWNDLPFLRLRSSTAAPVVAKPAEEKKPGLVGRALNRLKKLFGGK